MASISIPWNDGPCNIVLTYTGQGNDTVIVASDTNNVGYDRQQQITFVVTDGAIRHIIGTSSEFSMADAAIVLAAVNEIQQNIIPVDAE